MNTLNCRPSALVVLAVLLCSRLPAIDLTSAAAPGDEARDQQAPVSPPITPQLQSVPLEPKGSFIAAPLPVSSAAIGTGVVPVVGYIFPFSRKDHISDPSTVGAGGLFTSNGTRAYAAYADLNMGEDRYEIRTIYVRGNLNYDLYGIGILAARADTRISLKQTGEVFFGEFLARVRGDFHLGPRLLIGNSVVTSRDTGNSAKVPPDLGLHTSLTAIGLRLSRDTGNAKFYPTSGSRLDVTADFFLPQLGSKYRFQSYGLTFNKYFEPGEKQVIAYNLYVCGTGGRPPFYGNCIYGKSNELRGYVAGRYLDRAMFATQAEYRLSLPKRIGVALFGGVGEVFPGATQIFQSRNVLPAVGVGPRFQLSKKYHVNLRADIAWGRDGHTWGLGIGEAF